MSYTERERELLKLPVGPDDEAALKVARTAYVQLVRIWKEHIIKLIKERPLERFIASLPEGNKGDVFGYIDELQDTGIKYKSECDFEWASYCQAHLQALMEVYPEHEETWYECWGPE